MSCIFTFLHNKQSEYLNVCEMRITGVQRKQRLNYGTTTLCPRNLLKNLVITKQDSKDDIIGN